MVGATHKSQCGKWLYKVTERDVIFDMKIIKVEFWDVHLNRWSPSIMTKSELVKL